MMKELITEQQAVFVINLIACLTLPLGLAVGWLYSLRRRRNTRLYLAYGLLGGLSGPFIFLMWKIYSLLVNHYGLDSVKGLMVELLVFVLVGLALGFILAQLVAYLRFLFVAKKDPGTARGGAGKAVKRAEKKKISGKR